MSLLSPLSLLIFVPLGTVIVLLYLLKLKRKERLVSSVLLWQDAVADIQANAPFQKLKKNLLLLLQLLALLSLIIALARPFIRTHSISGNKVVIILDSSASMKSTDVSPSRFEQAKSKVLDIAHRMGSGDSMLIIAAGAKARVVTSFTSDKKNLSSAIKNLKPSDAGCDMRQAMVLALSLVAGKSAHPPRVVVLSDGRVSALRDLPARDVRLDFIKIGSRCNNVAITSIASRKNLSGEQQVFIALKNFAKEARVFNLELSVSGQLIDIREEKLTPGEVKQEILNSIDSLGGRIDAKLDISDDLAVDNVGSVYVSKPKQIDILMISKGNVFLQSALNLDSRIRLVRADAIPADFNSRTYEIVVFDQIAPPDLLPPGGYLLIGCGCKQGPSYNGNSVTRPVIVSSAKNHTVSTFVDFSNLRILKANYLKAKPWATSILEGSNGSLGVAGSEAGRRFVHVSFSLLDSDFPLRVGFPIFMANCIDYLTSPDMSGSGSSVRTGQPVYLDVPPNVTTVDVTDPSGCMKSLKVTQTPVIFDDTDQAGVYRISGKGVKKEIACNLVSMEESNTSPRDILAIGKTSYASSNESVETNRELYGFLILLALGVLTFEWYVYHRRL